MAYLDVKKAFANLENINEETLASFGFDDEREIVEEILFGMVNEFESWEAAKALVRRIRSCKSEEEYNIINNVFIDIFGWSLETFVEDMNCYISKGEPENV